MYKKALYACLFFLAIGCQQAFAQTLSDKDLKKQETPVNGSLQSIVSLTPVVYEYNTSTFSYLKLPKGPQFGFNVGEFQKVFPSLVTDRRHSYMQGKNRFKSVTVQSVDMESLIPVLVAAIKEQQTQIDMLKAEISSLKKGKE